MLKLKCSKCGHIFEVDVEELDVDYEVENFSSDSVEVTITVTYRCPKCGKRIIYGVETVSIPLKIMGEVIK